MATRKLGSQLAKHRDFTHGPDLTHSWTVTKNERVRPSGRIYLYPGAGRSGHNVFRVGTFEDLRAEGIKPAEGMSIRFWCGDADSDGKDDPLLFEGTVHYDTHLPKWYALIDEATYHHASDDLKD